LNRTIEKVCEDKTKNKLTTKMVASNEGHARSEVEKGDLWI